MSADAIFFKGGSCQKMNRDMIVLLDNSENMYLNGLAPMNLHSSNKALKPQ